MVLFWYFNIKNVDFRSYIYILRKGLHRHEPFEDFSLFISLSWFFKDDPDADGSSLTSSFYEEQSYHVDSGNLVPEMSGTFANITTLAYDSDQSYKKEFLKLKDSPHLQQNSKNH